LDVLFGGGFWVCLSWFWFWVFVRLGVSLAGFWFWVWEGRFFRTLGSGI